jgi:hypothetical protein
MKAETTKAVLVLLLIAPVRSALSQDAPAPFTMRIMDRGHSRYTCTVITQTRLRREVSLIADNSPKKTEVFEGAASDVDVSRAHALATDPAFLAAAQTPRSIQTADGYMTPQPGEVVAWGRDNRFINLIVDEGGKQRVLNAIVSGQGRAPAYVKGFISFADDLKKRKMNKVPGKVDLMCVIPLRDALKIKTTGR